MAKVWRPLRAPLPRPAAKLFILLPRPAGTPSSKEGEWCCGRLFLPLTVSLAFIALSSPYKHKLPQINHEFSTIIHRSSSLFHRPTNTNYHKLAMNFQKLFIGLHRAFFGHSSVIKHKLPRIYHEFSKIIHRSSSLFLWSFIAH